MNDQNQPVTDPAVNSPQNQPEPVVDETPDETVFSSTPLTPKPGEVVRPTKKLQVSDILQEEVPVAEVPSVPSAPVISTPAVPPTVSTPSLDSSTVTEEIKSPVQPEPVKAPAYPADSIPVPGAPAVPETVTPVTPPVTPEVPIESPKAVMPELPVETPVQPITEPVEVPTSVVTTPSAAPLTTPSDASVAQATAQEAAMLNTSSAEQSSDLPKEEKPKKSHKGLVIGIVVFILFAGAISGAAYLLYFGNMMPEIPEEEEIVEESTESEEIIEEEVKDVTSVKYLETLFKDLDAPVEELRSDTNFEDIMKISGRSEF